MVHGTHRPQRLRTLSQREKLSAPVPGLYLAGGATESTGPGTGAVSCAMPNASTTAGLRESDERITVHLTTSAAAADLSPLALSTTYSRVPLPACRSCCKVPSFIFSACGGPPLIRRRRHRKADFVDFVGEAPSTNHVARWPPQNQVTWKEAEGLGERTLGQRGMRDASPMGDVICTANSGVVLGQRKGCNGRTWVCVPLWVPSRVSHLVIGRDLQTPHFTHECMSSTPYYPST